MADPGPRREHGPVTKTPIHPWSLPRMPATIQFKFPTRPATDKPSALERLTAAYGRSHHAHVTPIVGCYLCLHDAARRPLELASAA
jgi:hypothetical protein